MPQRDRIIAADQSAFMSLFGLSAASVMRSQMLWDAENRLAAYIPLNQSGGAKKVTFKYDYRGRRVEKNVFAWNSGGSAWYTVPTERRRFVWNGWLMLRETIETDSASDGTFEATRVKTYTWGRDLGGGLESAGGIGGLLAVYDDNGTSSDLSYVYMYDANGNVGQVCNVGANDAASSIVAKYEYDAYGNATVSGGSYATANTYRFSTKPWDDETGLGYWGYRYYDPRLGRWMSRDPIGEKGGINTMASCHNSLPNRVDPFGMVSIRYLCEILHMVVFCDPIDAIEGDRCRERAVALSSPYTDPVTKNDTPKSNAIRHCLFSACLYRNTNNNDAADILAIYEAWGTGSACDRAADEHNNEIGHQIGHEAGGEKEHLEKCLGAWENGELISETEALARGLCPCTTAAPVLPAGAGVH